VSRLFSSRQIIRALERAGFKEIGQRGRHKKFRAIINDQVFTVIVKHPSPEVPAGTFASILRQAGMSRKELEKYLY